MERVRVLILSRDKVNDNLQEVISKATLQTIDAELVLKLMLQMFKSRAKEPMQFVLLHEKFIGFTNAYNHSSDLGYVGPPKWSSNSGWLYIIGRDPGEEPVAFSQLADHALAWCNTFPEVCSAELAADMSR